MPDYIGFDDLYKSSSNSTEISLLDNDGLWILLRLWLNVKCYNAAPCRQEKIRNQILPKRVLNSLRIDGLSEENFNAASKKLL